LAASRPARIAYGDRYTLSWEGHVFPVGKYRATRDLLRERGIAEPQDFFEPNFATDEELRLVHTQEYLARLETLTARPELGYLEFEAPCSRQVLDAFRAMAGGTVACARRALETQFSANLGGGFHHAFADHGEGFCAIHDVAVGLRVLLRDRAIERAAIVDLDVHQGNGSARIFQADPAVFTFSIHQENNYPIKEQSDLDIGLDDGVGDHEYLEALRVALPGILDRHRPGIVAYVAGADPFREDQLGGLALTREGLAARDRLVFTECASRKIPVFATLAGGYSRDPRDVVEIHTEMVRLGLEILGRP
jgi:acetoin utilization deacetylase AcuC-like enzyme